MAKAKPKGGRVTPKGGRVTTKKLARNVTAHDKHGHPAPSGRYTPPVPRELKVSAPWVPVLMFTLLGVGMLVIVCNYLGILPGDAQNRYLFGGLGLITAGFLVATRYR